MSVDSSGQSPAVDASGPVDRRVDRRVDMLKTEMPLLERAGQELKAEGLLQGLNIGLCLPLDEKSAHLVQLMVECGADVSCWSPQTLASSKLATSLRSSGVAVFLDDQQLDRNNKVRQMQDFISTEPEILLDNDGSLLTIAHEHFSDSLAKLKGAIILERTGAESIQALLDQRLLKTPVVNLNDAQLVALYHHKFGAGQSIVMALLDISNLQIAGRTVLVIGYGQVGQGVAMHAAAMGARVMVAEINPLKALQAVYDGHLVRTIGEAVSEAEIVFSATGCTGTLKSEHIDAMPDGVIICSAGSGQAELPMRYFLQEAISDAVREHVTDYRLPNGKHVLLMTDGQCINKVAAPGMPIEIADKIMALQLVAIEYILSGDIGHAGGLHVLPEAFEERIAEQQLAQSGVLIENK